MKNSESVFVTTKNLRGSTFIYDRVFPLIVGGKS